MQAATVRILYGLLILEDDFTGLDLLKEITERLGVIPEEASAA